jgi:hypothetical protein
MNPLELIVTLLAKYGVPAVFDWISASQAVTAEQRAALKAKLVASVTLHGVEMDEVPILDPHDPTNLPP